MALTDKDVEDVIKITGGNLEVVNVNGIIGNTLENIIL